MPPRNSTLATPQINTPIEVVNHELNKKQVYDRIATESGFQERPFTSEIEELRTSALTFLRGENNDASGQDVVLTTLLMNRLGLIINQNSPLFFRPSTGSEEFTEGPAPSELVLFGSPSKPFDSIVGKIHFSSAERVTSGYLSSQTEDMPPFLLLAKDIHGIGFHDLPQILRKPHPLREFNNRIAIYENNIVNALGPIMINATQKGYL